jgi:uncharacterized membrane protein YhfC
MENPVVEPLNILLMFSTLILSIGFPIVIWILFARKRKGVSIAVIAGAAGFFVPQMIIRLPVISLLSVLPGWVDFNENNILLSISLFAITAALFESTGRLVVFKALLKNKLSYNSAVGAGIGHGGIESIFLIGLTYINNIVFSLLINNDMLPDIPGMDQAVKALTQTAPELFFLAGIERVFTIFLHIALSVLLCYFIIQKRALLGFLLTTAIHFLIDFIVPILSVNKVSFWLIEGVLLIVAIFSILFVRSMKMKYPEIEISKDPAEIALEEGY